ncbi:MAG: MarR family transcriptional regulator [Candidatus Dormibacteria bacterium]
MGQTASQRAEALLRELRHLQDNVQALLKGPRPDVRADQDLVTGRQGRALYLIRDGAMTMGQLASELGVQPGAATAVADRLVQLGLAERLRSPLDRRLVQISATERGIQLMRDRNVWEARALGALAAALEQVEPGYGLTATDQLIRLLEAALEVAGSAGQTTLSTDTTAALRITALETDAVS